MCSPSHFCSSLQGHPPHPCQLFAGEHKFGQETRAEEVRLCQFYLPSITPARTPTSLVLPAIPRTPLSSKNSTRTLLFGSPSDSARNLDVLCRLPPEVATQILSYLHPRDLCQVCLVSCNWYSLAQHHALRKRRQLYVQVRREEYLHSKENFSPYVQTPRRPPMTTASTPLAPVQLRTTQRSSVPASPSTILPTWSRRSSLFESPTVPVRSWQPSNCHHYSLQDSPRDVEPLDQYSNGNELPLALSKHRLNYQLDSPMEPAQRLWRGGNTTESLPAQGLQTAGNQWSIDQRSPFQPTFQWRDSVNRRSSFHTMQSPHDSTDGVVNTAPPSGHNSTAGSLEEAEMNAGQQWSHQHHQSGGRADSPIKSGLLWSSHHCSVFASDSPVTQPPSCQRRSIAESPVLPFQLHRKRLVSSPETRQRSSTPPITIQHSMLHRQNSMPTIPSSACLEHTPDPLHLIEEVKGLSINEKEVRRQLFPNSVSSTADGLGRSHSPILCLHQPETLVGRKANRSRLRRL